MIGFIQLPASIQGPFLLLPFMLILIESHRLCLASLSGASAKRIVWNSFGIAWAFIAYELLFAAFRGTPGLASNPLTEMPFVLLLVLVGGHAAYSLFQIRRLEQDVRRTVTTNAIKESMDELPSGLCYWWDGGQPMLVNASADSIAVSLTGHSLRDAQAFVDGLVSGAFPGAVLTGTSPIYRLADGRVFGFKSSELLFEGDQIHELIASDVSDAYALTLELEERQAQAEQVNERLRTLMGAIAQTALERETLEAKIAIHDNLGQALLMAGQYLISPDDVDVDALIDLWKLDTDLLRTASMGFEADTLSAARTYVEVLGIELGMHGERIAGGVAEDLCALAIRAQAGNVIRHAHGDRVDVYVTNEPDGLTIRITNNGEKPAGRVVESGGLANLRRMVEASGASMRIEDGEAFAIVIVVPEEVRHAV